MDLKPNSFRAMCDLELERGVNNSTRLLTVKVGLEIGDDYDEDMYGEEEEPNEAAIRMITGAFIQGLVANIKMAHKAGFWNESKHMQHIFDQLNDGFINTVEFEILKNKKHG